MSSVSEVSPLALWFPGMTPADVLAFYPIQPLDTPGEPVPGPGFLREAQRLGDPPWRLPAAARKRFKDDDPPPARPLLNAMTRAALYRDDFFLNVSLGGGRDDQAVPYVPGHRFDFPGSGPVPCDVMIVGKIPGQDELRTGSNFSGPTSTPFWRALGELGVSRDEFGSWYATNLVRFPHPDPKDGKIPGDWIKDGWFLLRQELRLVLPKYVLLLGAEAAKAFFGRSARIGELAGRVYEGEVPVIDKDGRTCVHSFRAMACLHPAFVHRTPEAYPQLRDGLALFLHMARGGVIGDEEGLERHYVRTAADIEVLVDAVLAETPSGAAIALDCEWDGDGPWDPAAYLRTVQFSHRPKFGASIVVRLQGGAPNPDLPADVVRDQLLRLCKSRSDRPVRIVGHNLKSDLPWLLALGVDVREEFDAPEDDPPDASTWEAGWQKTKTWGGFDTLLAAHAVNETGPTKLETLASTLLGLPRYDAAKEAWIAEYCRTNKIKEAALTGYGHVPDEVLLPYGAYDADATLRLFHYFNGSEGKDGPLDRDRFGLSSREAFWRCQGEALALAEMESNGLVLDMDRVRETSLLFTSETSSRLAAFRQKYNWPTFNQNSAFDKRAFLFGDALAGKYDPETGHPISVAPPGAVCLGLMPIATTKKSGGRPWQPAFGSHRGPGSPDPSTDKTTLGIYALTLGVAEVNDLREILALGQAVKTLLKPPSIDTDEDGDPHEVYEKGLASHLAADGRVRTSFLLAETGRLRSFRPNLQNITGDGREEYFQLLLGDRYRYGLRGLFKARPGCVLVEADYAAAEVAMAAWLSGDPVLMEHYRRSLLDPKDPDFYDIHCNNAVMTFKLNCAPTKEGLKSIGRKGLRTAAKRTIFGSFYDQGAEGMLNKANEEGAGVTLDEVHSLRDFLAKRYPRLYSAFFPACQARPSTHGFLITCFGRPRRWPEIDEDDDARAAEFGREAQNGPIQGGVADVLRTAVRNLYRYRRDHSDIDYDLVLQVHDSVYAEVPIKHLERYYDEVLPRCMVDGVPIVPTDLDGKPTGAGPYHLGIGRSVYLYWGEPITTAEAQAHGIPERFVKGS